MTDVGKAIRSALATARQIAAPLMRTHSSTPEGYARGGRRAGPPADEPNPLAVMGGNNPPEAMPQEPVSMPFDNLHPQLISQRAPTNAGAPEDPNAHALLSNMSAARAHQPSFQYNVDLLKGYNQLTPQQTRGTHEEVAEHFIEHMKNNLLHIHDSMEPEFRERTRHWYVGANRIAQQLADRHGIPLSTAAATIAAMSPQKDWFQNASLAERLLDIHHKHKETPFTHEMEMTTRRIFGESKFDGMLNHLRGKKYGELTKPGHKAAWIRAFDQTYHDPAYREITPLGDLGDFVKTDKGENSKAAWGSLSEIAKGVEAIESEGSREAISRLMGERHKIRNFYNNILDPHSPTGDATVDTHAVAGAHMMPYGGNAVPVLHNFKNSPEAGFQAAKGSGQTGIQGTYPFYYEAMHRAARERKVEPREMQSMTWEGARALFPDVFKTKANVARVDQIWKKYQTGEYDANEARRQIMQLAGHGGGVIHEPRPSMGRSGGSDERQPDSTYQRKLPEGGLRGPSAGVDAGSGGGSAAEYQGLDPSFVRQSRRHRQIAAATRSLFDEKTGLPASYRRAVRGRPEAQLTAPAGATVKDVFHPTPEALHAFGGAGVSAPPMVELGKTPGSAAAFHAAIAAAKAAHPSGAAVYAYSPKEYRGMRMFMAPDAKAGFALKGDDIVSVFNHHGSPHKGVANSMLQLALQEGGRRLDAFDTSLPHHYSRNKFEVASRRPWNEEYKPDGWDAKHFEDYKGGKPDVVYMHYNPEKLGLYDEQEGVKAPTDAAALKEQDKGVSRGEGKLAKRALLHRALRATAARADGGPVVGGEAGPQSDPASPPVAGSLAPPLQKKPSIAPPVQQPRAFNGSGMYSHAVEEALRLPQVRGAPHQMLASLKGVKKEELDNAGSPVGRYADPKSITREELAHHFRTAMPRIHESEFNDNEPEDPDEHTETQYKDYTIPGGKNYRELLLHLPPTPVPPPTPELQAALQRQHDTGEAVRQHMLANGIHRTQRYGDQHFVYNDGKNDPEYQRLQEVAADAQRGYNEKQQAHVAKVKDKDFHSSHWSTPNVLAHLRMSDRQIPTNEPYFRWRNQASRFTSQDFPTREAAEAALKTYPESTQGRVKLEHGDSGRFEGATHLEELQSDWGQHGREKGFRDADWHRENSEREALKTKKYAAGDEGTGLTPAEAARYADLVSRRIAAEKKVPHGPYVTSTNGWTDLGLKRALLEAARAGHDRLVWTPDAEHDRMYPGRESTESHEGGNKGYYDKIIPLRMREILKKLGHEARFEPVTVTHKPKDNTPPGPHNMRTTLHSLHLPPELRDKIKKGLPAFARGGAALTQKPTRAYAAGGGVHYDTWQDGPFWRVARKDLGGQPGVSGAHAPEVRGPGGAPDGGGAGPVGDGAAEPHAARRLAQLQAVADRHANAHGRGPVLDDGNSPSSLHKQSAIGRAFQLAATEHPGYKRAVFDAYRRSHPDLIRQSGARDYDSLRHAAYTKLGHEVRQQFDDLPVKTSYHHGEGDYTDSKEMRHDVLHNGHLAVFQGGDRHDFLHHVDPRTKLNENEMFRAVHDAYGHALHGSTFGAQGEERAWNAHRQMFSPLASLAMSAETRGQNSFVNYTPINAQLKADKHEIEAEIARARRFKDHETEQEALGRKKKTMAGWQYAPQKAVLLPPEMIDSKYEGGMPDYLQHLIKPEPGTGLSSPITHFSHSPDVKELDPSRYGAGIPGDERSRVLKRPGGVKERAYGYLGAPGQVKPEPGLGPHAYQGQANDLYDLHKDPLKLALLATEANRTNPLGNFNPGVVNTAQANNDMERMAKEHGYSGVANPKAAYPMAALFNKTPVQPTTSDDSVAKALRLTAPAA